jgi:DNA-directed RNA polymerase subunit RPC12/RpoP
VGGSRFLGPLAYIPRRNICEIIRRLLSKSLMTDATPSSQIKVHRYLCPGCSADLVFEPKDGCLSCPYCGREEPIPATPEQIEERSYDAYLKLRPDQLSPLAVGALEVQCAGCGSAVTFAPPDIAGECPFCGAKIVAEPKVADPLLAPESVLPFKVTHPQAADAIKAWLGSRWFAPKALLQLARQESTSGVYLPFWTYDAYTVSHYTGERGEHYWETETYTETDNRGNRVTRSRQVRKTRWYPASGTVSRWFDDVLVTATQSLPHHRLEALTPWDLAELKPYDAAYLAGYKAQRYQVDLRQGFEIAKQMMAETIRQDVHRDIGGDEQRIHQIASSYSAITFKHLLLPLWVSAYRFNNKVYQVLVNARTTEVQGDRPYSIWKITAFIVLMLLILALVLYLSNK